MSIYKVINLSYLNDIADGDKEFIREILGIFVDQMPGEEIRLREAIAAEDWQMVRNVAHKVKSSTGNLGIKKAYDNFAEIEERAQKKLNLDTLPALIDETLELCRLAMGEVDDVLKNL